MGMQDHLSCLLRNLYAGQEAEVRTGHGTTDWFLIGKGVCQGCVLSLCLFNLYAECIMWTARLGEAQAEIKTCRRNLNNLRYADETTLMAESKEELCPSDSKEIKWVNPKGNQPCLLEGLLLKLKLQCSGHLMPRADLLGKTLMLGKTEIRRRRGWQRMRWLYSITA